MPAVVRLVAAALLATAGIAYGTLWAYHTLRGYDVLSDWLSLPRNSLAGRAVELGCDIKYDPRARGVVVTAVRRGSPAEAAGLREGDLVVSVDGRSVRESARALGDVYLTRRPGDSVHLGVLHRSSGEPVLHPAVFRERPLPTAAPALVRILFGTSALFPFVLLAVALPVLFYRLHDANAWLLAGLFLCLIAAPPFPNGFDSLEPAAAPFARTYRALMGGLVGPLFYWLFAVFPSRSPIDRGAPWLKWVFAGVGVALGASGLSQGSASVASAIGGWLDREAAGRLGIAWSYGPISLGVVSLLLNAWHPASADARRKIQVIVWGTLVGIVPVVTLALLRDLEWVVPDWISTLAFLGMFLFPLSFAYAVLRHRVLELPVLLRRSARYVLVRRGFGVLLVLLALAANAVFALVFTRLFRVDAVLATTVGAGFGLVLAAASVPGVRGATTLIDRAFFREAYDARQLLEELAERIRTVDSQTEIGLLLEKQLHRALHPRAIVSYFLSSPDRLVAADDGGTPVAAIPAAAPGLSELARRDGPTDFLGEDGRPVVPALGPVAPECLVPIVTRGRLLGLVALGPRLSEEPYSGEDARLLATVAAQAAIALDNLALARRMAERLEAERRAAHEMELARQVQAQLLPREGRRLSTLECAGRCVQARAVGGDYFDFVNGAEGHLVLVLADVSGKGFAAALLMASLQAGLRTALSRAEGLAQRLGVVNHLLFEASEPSRYATLFLGEYDEAGRRLRYVNCGHNPPLLQRATGEVERLMPTAMVIGLAEPWACDVGEVALRPGDLLVAYSDGISEAADASEREFGEERILETVHAHREAPLPELLDAVFGAASRHREGEQADDQTLLVARAR